MAFHKWAASSPWADVIPTEQKVFNEQWFWKRGYLCCRTSSKHNFKELWDGRKKDVQVKFCKYPNSTWQMKQAVNPFFWVFGLDTATTKWMLLPKMRSNVILTNKIMGWPCGVAAKNYAWFQMGSEMIVPSALHFHSSAASLWKKLGKVRNKTAMSHLQGVHAIMKVI